MEREVFNERNCFQQDAKPENLACHIASVTLVILFIQSNKDRWLAFCAVYIVRTRHGQMMHILKTLLPNKIEAK